MFFEREREREREKEREREREIKKERELHSQTLRTFSEKKEEMNIPAVDSAPPMSVVILMPKVSVRTPATTENRKVEPMDNDITMAAGRTCQGKNYMGNMGI